MADEVATKKSGLTHLMHKAQGFNSKYDFSKADEGRYQVIFGSMLNYEVDKNFKMFSPKYYDPVSTKYIEQYC